MASDSGGDMIAGTIGMLLMSVVLFFGFLFYFFHMKQTLPENTIPLKVFKLDNIKIIDSKHFRKNNKDIYFIENFPLAQYKGTFYGMQLKWQGEIVCTSDKYDKNNCQIVDKIINVK